MTEIRSVITLANSIIGVSILAMPFCFKQCGIVLAVLMIFLSGVLVKSTSYFLLKSAMLARRGNYGTLAFDVFGSTGKMSVELGMIGYLLGSCIAFFVVIGDLAPPIMSNVIGEGNSDRFRISILIGMGLFVVFPLSLLRNVESLAVLCTASIAFYGTVMVFIMFTSFGSFASGEWWASTAKWRPSGIFQCLPILCMALSCQPQLFEIYDALPDPSLNRMVEVVKGAVHLCSGVYIAVGFFGYVALHPSDFGGNILMSFNPSWGVELCKMGFVVSVAVSFPLVIFPCRTAIHSLIFKKAGGSQADIIPNHIPPNRFVFITAAIVFSSCLVAINVPDIELVLGLVGSTIGTVICILFPVSLFIRQVTANTTEKLAAQAIFVIGVIVLVLGTYVTLNEADNKSRSALDDQLQLDNHQLHTPVLLKKPRVVDNIPAVSLSPKMNTSLKLKGDSRVNVEDGKVRKEPVQPLPPKDSKEKLAKLEESGGNVAEPPVKKAREKKLPPEEKVKASEKEILEKEWEMKRKENDLERREEKAEQLIKELSKQKDEHDRLLEKQKEVLEAMKQRAHDEDKPSVADSNRGKAPQMESDSREGKRLTEETVNQPSQQQQVQQPGEQQIQPIQPVIQQASRGSVQQPIQRKIQQDDKQVQQPIQQQAQQPIQQVMQPVQPDIKQLSLQHAGQPVQQAVQRVAIQQATPQAAIQEQQQPDTELRAGQQQVDVDRPQESTKNIRKPRETDEKLLPDGQQQQSVSSGDKNENSKEKRRTVPDEDVIKVGRDLKEVKSNQDPSTGLDVDGAGPLALAGLEIGKSRKLLSILDNDEE